MIRSSFENPSLSVVMPTHQRRHLLVEVLPPLLEDPSVSEIVVVVDGSQDGSVELLESMARQHPTILPVVRKVAGGNQVAMAEGLSRATGDVVLFLDDDVRAGSRLGEHHLAHHRSREKLVVLGYMPIAKSQTRVPGEFATPLYAEEYEGCCRLYEADPSTILRSLWWGNVSIRRADLLAVGLNAPDYEATYHQDQDLGLRLLEAGFTATFDRSLVATHLHQRSLPSFIRDATAQGRGRVLVYERHKAMMGELTPAAFEDGLGPALSVIVRAGANPRISRPLIGALSGLVRIAGALHLFRIETDAARLLRRIAQRAGAEQIWRTRRSASTTEGDAP
jgi:GT2 family glycosyltransferase